AVFHCDKRLQSVARLNILQVKAVQHRVDIFSLVQIDDTLAAITRYVDVQETLRLSHLMNRELVLQLLKSVVNIFLLWSCQHVIVHVDHDIHTSPPKNSLFSCEPLKSNRFQEIGDSHFPIL